MRNVLIALAIFFAACAHISPAPDDSAIRDAVRGYLIADGFVDIAVVVVVDHGVVTLSGSLSNATQREKAGSDAERADGVRRVINHIVVRP
jgi:osmotically-inducible protein OsmY